MTTARLNGPRTATLTAALLCAAASLGGCASTYTDYSAFVRDPQPLVSTTDYVLAPPDSIVIYSKRVREVNGHSETIRPDGKITLPLLGSVFVTGKTPEQVSAELEGMARDYYADADISLRVTGFNSKKIFVWGEVGTAGPYPYNGANTVLETLALAQPTRLADPAKIAVLRPNKDGKLVKKMTIDLNHMVKDGVTEYDVVLEEGDILYVPPNPLAAVGLAFQQLLLPIQPAASTVSSPTTFDNTFRTKPYGDQGGPASGGVR